MVVKDKSFKCLNNPKSFILSPAKIFVIKNRKLTETGKNANLLKRWGFHI